MLRFRGKDVLRISKYNMLMFIILGLLGLGISVGYLCRHVPAFKGLEHSISYTIFAMLFIFGITIGANQSLLNNIGEFGIQAAILAYIIHSGFISGYQNRYGDNLKPPTNVYHRMTA